MRITEDHDNMHDTIDSTEHWFEKLSARDKRALVFHLLYMMESHDYTMNIEAIVDNLNRGFDLNIPCDSDVVKIAEAVANLRDTLDEQYKPFLNNWRYERLGICTKLILRYALWELANTDTAPIIVINEAIELAKCYAEKDAYKFVNGVLDEALKKVSVQESIN